MIINFVLALVFVVYGLVALGKLLTLPGMWKAVLLVIGFFIISPILGVLNVI